MYMQGQCCSVSVSAVTMLTHELRSLICFASGGGTSRTVAECNTKVVVLRTKPVGAAMHARICAGGR